MALRRREARIWVAPITAGDWVARVAREWAAGPGATGAAARILGTDPDEHAVAEARRDLPPGVVLAPHDPRLHPWPRELDLAVLTASLFASEDAGEAIEETRRSLRSHGWLLLTGGELPADARTRFERLAPGLYRRRD